MSEMILISFRADTLFAFKQPDGVYVAIKSISDALGLKWSGQHDRINRDPILSEGIRVIRIPSPGGAQETLCLRLDLMNGWLFTIDESRVKDDPTRQRVLAYKRECYAVLFSHFYGSLDQRPSWADIDDTFDGPDSLKHALVRERRQIWGNRVAAALWVLFKLPHVPEMDLGTRQLTLPGLSIQ